MYAFISLDQIVLFKQLKFVFQTLTERDDPFILNKRVHRPASQQPLSDSEFCDAMAKNYAALDAHIKAMVTFEYYLEQAKQNRHKIEQQLKEQILDEGNHGQVPLATTLQYQNVAYLRLFKSIHQQGLWDSVGSHHQGLAVKLNTHHDFFQHANYNGGPQLFRALTYDDARPSAPSSANPFPALLQRPEHFSYEQEFRLIRPLSTLVKKGDAAPMCQLPKGLIEGIYLGLNCSEHVCDTMKALVCNDLQFRGVTLKQIGVSETHLRLVATSILP